MPVYKDKKRNSWEVKTTFKTFDGKTKWVHKRGFEKKSDAQHWEIEFKSKNAGSLDMTLNSFIDIYLENIGGKIKQTTLFTKKNIIEKWIRPYLGDKQLKQITTIEIIAWHNMLLKNENDKNGKTFKKSYLKTVHNQLNAILNHARRYYRMIENPAQIVGNVGNEKEIEIHFWTRDQYMMFREEIMNDPLYFYAFEILYWCGIREGELLALTVGDIDFDQKTININKTLTRINKEDIITDPKTRKSKRKVSIPEFLCDELKDYLKMVYMPNKQDRLFTISKSSLTLTLKKAANKAGLPPIRVHDLRHSHVSLLIDLGYSAVSIAERVGHESVYITFHYAHMFPNVQHDMAKTLNGLTKEVTDE